MLTALFLLSIFEYDTIVRSLHVNLKKGNMKKAEKREIETGDVFFHVE